MIALGFIVAGVAVALFVRAARFPIWPAATPRPYRCALCDLDYSDARALAWHQAGQHPVTYDEARRG